ncbi:streptomycin 6-kinase [Jatrophihabitans sp. GAS493]|uniref:phosphotransferase family protein n=1 Tax=Jatrophihabitans sp. GAS493 TaxID=1907575 RepID=UPI000BB78697|nr:phosphotransferase family protein [Jatrophihabitans sp. GAS493]SOD71788.1 streptomycin 6-kinase [Jatrophihabitans sp. GAS493]
MTPDLFSGLATSIAQALGDGVRVTGLVTLEGGRSGVTLLADVDGLGTSGMAGTEQVVVKAAPAGRSPVGRHDVLRQARILTAVASSEGVVVPAVLATGTVPVHFYVMTRSAGEAVEPVLDAARVHLPAQLVTDRAIQAARMLAALHRVTDFPDTPEGEPEPEADLQLELERWRATGAAADPQILVGGERLATLLEAQIPSPHAPSVLVHGDFRLGNLVYDGPTPTGLIDWEIWGRTHPGIDLGWFLVFCDPDLFPGIGERVAGLPSSAELAQCYRDAGGRQFGNLEWFEAFGRFKMAAIMAHNLRRHREGRHHDPFQEKLPPTIARLVETGIEKLESMEH